MKGRLFVLLILTAGGLSVYPQRLLSAGDVFTYEFASLPYRGEGPGPERSLFSFSVNGTTLDSGDRLLYETFEDAPTGTPLCAGVLEGPPPPSLWDWQCNVNYGWQDLQGSVRFTMESGSVVLENLRFGVVQGPMPPVGRYYEMTVLVPEPSVLALGALALAGVLCKRLYFPNRHVTHI